jgi:hypothetical protein
VIRLGLQVIATLGAFSLVNECSPSKSASQELKMVKIEKQVQLPSGAWQLRDYDRFYTGTDHGKILAVYLLPPGGRRGQRRWLDKPEDLPFIDGGGCAEINLTFDQSELVVTNISCNPSS